MDKILVGIDFGTTNTVITYFDVKQHNSNSNINILKDSIYTIIPSKIGYYKDKIYCGNYIPNDCNDIIINFKTSIGIDKIFTFQNSSTKYNDIDLLLIFFNHLYTIIRKNLGNNKIEAIVTVPSNFNDKQREIIKQSFELVDINVFRIINEPSAAALAYGLNSIINDEEIIMVIDTGGGTIDFTILEKNDTMFQVLHSDGINTLGGNNFTQLIVDDIMNLYSIEYSNILWNKAQKMKEKLTYLDNYQIMINCKSENNNYSLSREQFNIMSKKLINKISIMLSNIMSNYEKINYVIMVGGTSKIPLLQKTIKNITNLTPWIHPNLFSVVSEGACIYNSILNNIYHSNQNIQLLDCLPLSLGVELVDGTYSVIIPKNTPLPVKRNQKYTTNNITDNKIKIKVYQGERKIASKNFLIGEFIFDKLSIGGVPIIDINFKVDINSIINISVVDRKSGIEKTIVFKDIAKKSTEEIDNIISTANNMNDIDETELFRNQSIYNINTMIENIMNNLDSNTLIVNEDKKLIHEQINIIENKLDKMNSMELLETVTNLEEKFNLLIRNTITDTDNDNINNSSNIDFIKLTEKKEELKNKITLLLVKNPDWEEYLKPVLDELEYNNITIDYIETKLQDIILLEKDDIIYDNNYYMNQTINLCHFIKNEINDGNIKLSQDKINQLILYINEIMEKINNDNSWEDELNKLNKKCESIYNL